MVRWQERRGVGQGALRLDEAAEQFGRLVSTHRRRQADGVDNNNKDNDNGLGNKRRRGAGKARGDALGEDRQEAAQRCNSARGTVARCLKAGVTGGAGLIMGRRAGANRALDAMGWDGRGRPGHRRQSTEPD